MLCKNFGCEEIAFELKETVDDETQETSFEITGTCNVCYTKHEFKLNWREIYMVEPLSACLNNGNSFRPWRN